MPRLAVHVLSNDCSKVKRWVYVSGGKKINYKIYFLGERERVGGVHTGSLQRVLNYFSKNGSRDCQRCVRDKDFSPVEQNYNLELLKLQTHCNTSESDGHVMLTLCYMCRLQLSILQLCKSC